MHSQALMLIHSIRSTSFTIPHSVTCSIPFSPCWCPTLHHSFIHLLESLPPDAGVHTSHSEHSPLGLGPPSFWEAPVPFSLIHHSARVFGHVPHLYGNFISPFISPPCHSCTFHFSFCSEILRFTSFLDFWRPELPFFCGPHHVACHGPLDFTEFGCRFYTRFTPLGATFLVSFC